MNAPRVVVDTNVLLDLWVFDDPAVQPLRTALDRGDWIALRSAPTDAELIGVLARSRFGLSVERQFALIADWQRRALLIERIFPAPWQCTDPHDQVFVDLAVCAHARTLITKDKALLRLARKVRPAGLQILTPSHSTFAATGELPASRRG